MLRATRIDLRVLAGDDRPTCSRNTRFRDRSTTAYAQILSALQVMVCENPVLER